MPPPTGRRIQGCVPAPVIDPSRHTVIQLFKGQCAGWNFVVDCWQDPDGVEAWLRISSLDIEVRADFWFSIGLQPGPIGGVG